MLELEDAFERILARIPPPISEDVAPARAHGRFAAKTVHAPINLPPFDNSSMDGYAVRAADVASATAENPVRLRLAGRIAAGQNPAVSMIQGQCVRLFTGSPLPAGADAVVMQEDTSADSSDSSQVSFLDSVKPWENIRFRGEDVKEGTPIIQTGDALTTGRVALLAALGLSEIAAGRRPTVGLLATGSELRESGQLLSPGQIYESNRAALAPLVKKAGGIPKLFPIVPDEPDATRAALDFAFGECDIVISCGGVSVGEMDFVKESFEQLGGRLDFWKVAIKPGRPFVFGQLGSRFLFGLPGNPVSAFVTFLLLVRPAILRWQGAGDISLPKHHGTLAEPIMNSGARRHFVRVRIEPDGAVRSAGIQASHALSSLASANGIVEAPPKTTLAAETRVAVLKWD
jgi:molybdopterin molybdotransferase